jgi:hypothetical protein
MTVIANATATEAASTGPGSQMAQHKPTTADKVLPATTAQGWASGLAGAVNTSTALAPMGATNQTVAAGASHALKRAVHKIPNQAPNTARKRSLREVVNAGGAQRATQSAKRAVVKRSWFMWTVRIVHEIVDFAPDRP